MLRPDHAMIPTSPTRAELPPQSPTAGESQLDSWGSIGETLEMEVPTRGSVTGKPLGEQNPLLVKRDIASLFLQGCIRSL